MARLRDRLNRVKVGGRLQRTTGEELQQLSQAAERPAPPTTPMEAGVLGGNKDQAKMVGTKQQKASALRLGIQGQQSLQDRLRTQQVRRQATGAEEQAMERGERVEQLGGLQGRVQALTEQMTQQAAGQQVDPILALRQEQLEQLEPEQQQQVEQLLGQLQQNPSDPNLILQLNQTLGLEDVDNMITPERLQEYFQDVEGQVGTRTAEAFQDQVTVEDLNVEELGFEGVDEVAALLGMTPEEARGLTARQLIEEAEAQIQEEFTQTEALRQRAQDPRLGPAERAEARRQLREMGAVGIRAAETDVDRVAQQIADADTIQFGGEDVRISEMLDDEYLSGLAARYLTADAEDPFRKRLEQEEPELTEWLSENQAVLQESVQEMDEGVADFAEIQYENQRLADTAIGEDLSDDIMSQLFPDWGKLRANTYSEAGEVPAVVQILNEEGPGTEEQANLYQAVTDLHDVSPALTQEIGTLTEAELDQLGATQGRDSTKFSTVKQYTSDVKRLREADPDQPDSVATAIMGKGTSWDEFQQSLRDSIAVSRSGLFGQSDLAPLEELYGASPEEAHQFVQEMLAGEHGDVKSLREMINSTPISTSKQSREFQTEFNDAKLSNKLGFDWDLVDDLYRENGKITVNDADELAGRVRGYETVSQMYNNPNFWRTLDPRVRWKMEQTYDKLFTKQHGGMKTATDFNSVEDFQNFVNEKTNLDNWGVAFDELSNNKQRVDDAYNTVKWLSENRSGIQQKYWQKRLNSMEGLKKEYDDRLKWATGEKMAYEARKLKDAKTEAEARAIIDGLTMMFPGQVAPARVVDELINAGKIGRDTGLALRKALRGDVEGAFKDFEPISIFGKGLQRGTKNLGRTVAKVFGR